MSVWDIQKHSTNDKENQTATNSVNEVTCIFEKEWG